MSGLRMADDARVVPIPHVAALRLAGVLARVVEAPEPETFPISRDEVLALYSLLSDWQDCREKIRMLRGGT